MFGIGFQEMLVILVVVLIFFGPKRLPDLAKSLGKGIAEFKKASDEVRQGIQEAMKEETPPAGDVPEGTPSAGEVPGGAPPAGDVPGGTPSAAPPAVAPDRSMEPEKPQDAPGGPDKPPAPRDA